APVEPGLGGGQGGADLRGVVAIVIDDHHAGGFAADLEATLDARESGQRLPDRDERDLEVEPDRDRGEGVRHVVTSWNLKGALAEWRAVVDDFEAAREPREVHAACAHVSARFEAIGDHAR